jgi:hypothetical protein
VLDSYVSNLDFTVVGVYVDGFTGELAVHNILLMEELETFEYLFGPIFYYFETRSMNLLPKPKQLLSG